MENPEKKIKYKIELSANTVAFIIYFYRRNKVRTLKREMNAWDLILDPCMVAC